MRIVWGKDKRALCRQCLNEIGAWQKQWPQKVAFMLVPENRKLNAEQEFLRLHPQSALLLCDVISLKRLGFRLLEDIGGGGEERLDEFGKKLLLRSVLLRLAEKEPRGFLAKFIHRMGYLDELGKLLSEFRRFAVRPFELLEVAEDEERRLGKDSREKLRALSQLLEAYEEELRKRGAVDPDLQLPRLADLLERLLEYKQIHRSPEEWPFPYNRLSFLTEASIWVDGFTDVRRLSAQEWRIFKALSSLCASFTMSCLTETLPTGMSGQPGPYFFGESTLLEWQRIRPGQVETVYCEPDWLPDKRELIALQTERAADEAKLCAAELYRLHYCGLEGGGAEGIPWSRMGVACCDTALEEPLAAALGSLGIPAYLDRRLSLAASPVIRYVLALLSLEERGWSREAVCAFLRTGLAGLDSDTIDKLENFWLARGMTGRLLFDETRYSRSWQILPLLDKEPESDEGPESEREDLSEEELTEKEQEARNCYKACEEALFPVKSWHEFWKAECKRRGGSRTAALLRHLLRFLEEQDIRGRIERAIAQAEKEGAGELSLPYAKAWQQLLRLLSVLYTLVPEDSLSLSELRELLYDILSQSYTETIPTYLQQVYVGSLSDVLAQRFDVVYLLGATISTYPLASQEEGLLKTGERDELNSHLLFPLPNAARLENIERLSREEQLRLAYTARLYVSAHGEKPVCPFGLDPETIPFYKFSSELGQEEVRGLFPDYSRLRDARRKRKESGEKYDSRRVEVPWADLSALAATPPVLSATALERYEACPYQFLMMDLLRLRPRPVWTPQSFDLGNLVHSVLERYLGDLSGKVGPEDFARLVQNEQEHFENVGWEPELERLIQEAILASPDRSLALFNEPGIRTSAGRQARKSLASVLPGLLDFYAGKEAVWLPRAFEWSFTERLPGGGEQPWLLRGKIDRIDSLVSGETTGFGVSDYKTGFKKVDYLRLYNHLDVQLPLYLWAYARKTGLEPVRAQYIHVRLPGSGTKVSEKQKALVLTPELREACFKDMEQYLGDVQRRITGGIWSPEPKTTEPERKPCRYCEARSVCGIDDPRTAGRICRGPSGQKKLDAGEWAELLSARYKEEQP